MFAKMFRKWRLTDRTRALVKLEMAIVLPAAALLAFSIWNLKDIQRSEGVEAALQRDFAHVLYFAEHKMWERAYAMVEPIRKDFPNPDENHDQIKAKLQRILAQHSEFAYVILYDKQTNLVMSETQPGRSNDEVFCIGAENAVKAAAKEMPLQAGEFAAHVRSMEKKEDEHVLFDAYWSDANNQHWYWNFGYFIPPKISDDRITLGLIAFDGDYVKNTFLPEMMKEVLSSKDSVLHADNPPVMMIRPSKDMTPWVSAGWDGGKPEAERPFQWIFQELTMGIKYQGTTVAEMGARFLRYNYMVLTALGILMAGGIWLTYRNVYREMKLARLKSDFVANVSHELRTPLALIRLYAETLELGRLNAKEKYQEYFHIIRDESERLTALINNILDFSRIEAGRKEYEFKETNLSDLVRSTLDAYRFQIEQNGFKFEENIAANIPPVNVDREAIARSLLNLVNNALKYSKDQKFIAVNLYRANGSVKLEVLDHGIGIASVEQSKIFEKFYRCGDPLVHNIKGSGLGLALVRHIVRAHGGHVQVESAPEKGSKFTIELPLSRIAHNRAAVAT